MSFTKLVDALLVDLERDSKAESLQEVVGRLRKRLRAPLRLAVTGAVSAGKSTLVNALIGRQLSATGEGEVTLRTTAYRYAEKRADERVTIRRPGRQEPESLPLTDLSTITGVDGDAEEPVVAYVHHPLLERIVVVDTPGLYSSSEGVSERTRAIVTERTRREVVGAGAVIHLSRDVPGRQADIELLDEFRSMFGSEVRRACTNVLFVLSGVDGLWREDQAQASIGSEPRGLSPLTLGTELLTERPETNSALRARVWDAVPVIGLLAETVRCTSGVNAELCDDARALAANPRIWSRLLDRSDFLATDFPGIGQKRRRALWNMLDAYGLVVLRDAGLGNSLKPPDLAERLLDASGIRQVEDTVTTVFGERDDLIIADDVISQLERVVTARAPDLGPTQVRYLRDRVDNLRVDERCQSLQRLRALRIAMDGETLLPDERRHEARRLLVDGTVFQRLGIESTNLESALTSARLAREWWTALAGAAPQRPERRLLAQVMIEAYDEANDALIP